MSQKRKTFSHRKINLVVAVFLLVIWIIGNLPDLTASLDRFLFRIRAETASFLFDFQAGPEATPCGDLCPQSARQLTPEDLLRDSPRVVPDNPLSVLLPLFPLLPLPSPTNPVVLEPITLPVSTLAVPAANHPDDQSSVASPTGAPAAITTLRPGITPALPGSPPTDQNPVPSASATAFPDRRFFDPSGDLDALFTKYGQHYGVDSHVLKKIAFCESTYNPGSVNHVYAGLFQFLASTWSATRREMALDPDPALRFAAEEAIKTAAFKISREGTWAWPVCGKV
jgi:hypothetical protein